jgi:CubicO group peptidase (beta-lactamase class C family)
MTASILAVFALLMMAVPATGQTLASTADSIRVHYKIPELGYAAICADSIIEMGTIGYQRNGGQIRARPGDRFHLGSNTKGITGFIAALLVKRKKIAWDTRFFDLFPELKSGSNPAYAAITLQDLLTHRAGIQRCYIDDSFPKGFNGSVHDNRARFVAWMLRQKPAMLPGRFSVSNGGYIVAARMLERASGKSWEQLVVDLGAELGVTFHFSYPNTDDSLQPWGHDDRLRPLGPRNYYKEGLLSAAGNINMSLEDYSRFVQLQLQGLQGRSNLLTAEEFRFLHFGLPEYAIGWAWSLDSNGRISSHHQGSAGTFCSQVYIFKDADRAYVVLTNSAPEMGLDAIDAMVGVMKRRYGE